MNRTKKIVLKIKARLRSRLLAVFIFFKVLKQFFVMCSYRPQRFAIRPWNLKLFLLDATTTTGFDRHYVFHTAWASRILAETLPQKHIDISSSLYFLANASAFVPIDFYDYRPATLNLSNLSCYEGDLCALPFADRSVVSISCMHVVEHVGLGRYGDSLDYDGDLKAVSELKRVTASGGNILFVVPISGVPRIEFNAHRVYSYNQVLDLFSDFTLQEFALIPDDPNEGGLIRSASPALANSQHYACGCFWFKRS